MKLTTNYGFKKPEGSDVVNVDDLNYNADIIDATIRDMNVRIDALNVKVDGIDLLASKVKMNDGTTVEYAVTDLRTQLSGQISRAKTILQSLASKVE